MVLFSWLLWSSALVSSCGVAVSDGTCKSANRFLSDVATASIISANVAFCDLSFRHASYIHHLAFSLSLVFSHLPFLGVRNSYHIRHIGISLCIHLESFTFGRMTEDVT